MAVPMYRKHSLYQDPVHFDEFCARSTIVMAVWLGTRARFTTCVQIKASFSAAVRRRALTVTTGMVLSAAWAITVLLGAHFHGIRTRAGEAGGDGDEGGGDKGDSMFSVRA